MGGQFSECRCNNESRPPNEVSLVRHLTQQDRADQDIVRSHSPQNQLQSPKEVLRQFSKKNSNRDTSNSTDQFKEQLDIKNFSLEAQKILRVMEMGIPEQFLRSGEAQLLISQEEERVFLGEDGFNYFGGIRNGDFHGLG